MRRPKLEITDAQLRKWRVPCPRAGCDGFLCTMWVSGSGGVSRKECNDCNTVAGYYRGEQQITKEEYTLAVERAQKRRGSGASPAARRSRPSEEDEMSKGKKAKSKSKKKGKSKGQEPKAAKATTTADAPRTKRTVERKPPAVGTLLTGTYKGEAYSVTVVKDGFQAGKETYKTLSRAAMALTGQASVNGWKFFGLA